MVGGYRGRGQGEIFCDLPLIANFSGLNGGGLPSKVPHTRQAKVTIYAKEL